MKKEGGSDPSFQTNEKRKIIMAKLHASPAGTDGVQYRKAKLWQIILVAANALNGMAIYIFIGQASYAASIGYGITTLIVGGLLTFTRIFDAITDPLLAFLYDRFNTRWGKVRPLMLLGWLIQSLGLMLLFSWTSSKGFGIPVFLGAYMFHLIGYTIVNMTAQTLPALMTNDPKQRPTVGVWSTVFNYIVPMAFTIILNSVLLPRFGVRAYIALIYGSECFNFLLSFLRLRRLLPIKLLQPIKSL